MNPKNGPKITQRKNFEEINSDVRSFYDYCKEAGMSDEEMDEISKPLTEAVREAVREAKKRRIRIIICLLIGLLALVALWYNCSIFRWHATVLARILLINTFPDTTLNSLYHNKCLIDRPNLELVDIGKSIKDCVECEAVRSVARLSDTSYSEVFNHHLIRGAPVIVTDAHYDWSSRADLNLTNLISDDDRLRDSVPCRILSNIRIGRQPMDLEEIVSRITNTEIPSWFVHFQNCDIRAVKSFRILAPRPYFLSSHIPPSHFNWLLLSKNYDTHRYKYLELDVGLIIMSQLRGKSFVQLEPKAPCENDCDTLSFELSEGDTLVLANALWEFEYLPGIGDNIAMITETDWSEY